MTRRRARRATHAAPALGTAAHHLFELAAGVGIVFQPELGLAGGAAAWGMAIPAWVWLATRSPASHRAAALSDDLLAAFAGAALAGALVHYSVWPVEQRRVIGGVHLPVLAEAEGIPAQLLPVYNALLYAWAVGSVGALAFGTPKGRRRWALLGLATAVPFRAHARKHFEWVAGEAESNPAWWNRALQPGNE